MDDERTLLWSSFRRFLVCRFVRSCSTHILRFCVGIEINEIRLRTKPSVSVFHYLIYLKVIVTGLPGIKVDDSDYS